MSNNSANVDISEPPDNGGDAFNPTRGWKALANQRERATMRTENSNITFCEDFTIAYPSSCPPSRHGVGTKPGEIVPNVRVKERVLTSKMQQTVLDAERYEERIPNDFNITFIEDFTNFLTPLASPSLFLPARVIKQRVPKFKNFPIVGLKTNVPAEVESLTPEGEEVSVQYHADETGFYATGSHVPQAPPMPAHVQRLLDHLAKVNGLKRL